MKYFWLWLIICSMALSVTFAYVVTDNIVIKWIALVFILSSIALVPYPPSIITKNDLPEEDVKTGDKENDSKDYKPDSVKQPGYEQTYYTDDDKRNGNLKISLFFPHIISLFLNRIAGRNKQVK